MSPGSPFATGRNECPPRERVQAHGIARRRCDMGATNLAVARRNDDDDAIREIAQTDRQSAYSRIVSRYREPLFRHAVAILKDWDEAIDAVQDVFVKAMREQRLFDDDFQL